MKSQSNLFLTTGLYIMLTPTKMATSRSIPSTDTSNAYTKNGRYQVNGPLSAYSDLFSLPSGLSPGRSLQDNAFAAIIK